MTSSTEGTGSPLLLRILQATAALQLAAGLALWSGHGYRLLPVHKLGGVVFVLLLWSVAARALRRGERLGLPLALIVWGLVLPALGFTQQRLVLGDLHWIIRLLHLTLGVAVMPLAAAVDGRAHERIVTSTMRAS